MAGRRMMGLVLAMGIGVHFVNPASAQEPAPSLAGAQLLDRLRSMGPAEIEAVYRGGTATAIPAGPIRGVALLSPGTRRARLVSRGARVVWQGKVFEPAGDRAVNRFFGLRIVQAQVYQGTSWVDGRPALVLDYTQTSRIYARYRDEIRQVAPGLYLGVMHDVTTNPPDVRMYFALEASQ